MDKYAVFGNPIKQSKSPYIHQQFAEQTLQELKYVAIEPELDNFKEEIEQFIRRGGKGCNVTMPFKEHAYDIAHFLSDRAKLAGAVNTLSFNEDGSIFGDNTDGAGLVADLKANGAKLNGKILLIGAGGAARGVIKPLLDCKPELLVVVNRTFEKAQFLAEKFECFGSIQASPVDDLVNYSPFDTIINSTSTSLSGQLPPVSADIFKPNSFAYDMVYSAEPTTFLIWAADNGCYKAVDGLGMLVGQAAESFSVWRDIMPDHQPVLNKLRNDLNK